MTGAFSTLHVLGAASFAPMARYSGFAATRSSAVGPRMVYNVDAAMAVDGQSSMYNFADGAGTVAARVGQRWGNGGYYDRGMGRGGTQNPYAMNRRRRMLDMAAPYEDEMYGGGAYDVPPPPYDMAPPPYDEMPPPQPYDRMGMEPPPYDLERRIVELERALMGNGGAMGGGVMGGGMGMGGRLDWLDSQLGPTSGPDMDRLSRLEDMARRQGLYDNYGGGYQQPGYQQPMPNGGYQQPMPNGGFQQPGYQQNGGFQQPGYQQNGGFQQPGYQQNGGFQQPGYQQNGGYQQPGYQQPGFQQQPSAGGNMFDNFGNSVSQFGNSVSNFFQGR